MIDLSKEILYEDVDVLAVNKPAGIVVHPDGKSGEPAVTDWFREKYPESLGVGEPMGEVARPGVVHRLDKETSGVLLMAKTTKGYDALKRQFRDRSIDKIYHLFVYGVMKDEFGTINLPIGRSARDFRKRVAGRGARGELREALTYYKVLERIEGEGVTLVEAKPKTGRTHQIRIHFKAIHHPVVSDRLYAKSRPSMLGFERLALHARSIEFENTQGKKVRVESPYPEDFMLAMDKIKFGAGQGGQ